MDLKITYCIHNRYHPLTRSCRWWSKHCMRFTHVFEEHYQLACHKCNSVIFYKDQGFVNEREQLISEEIYQLVECGKKANSQVGDRR